MNTVTWTYVDSWKNKGSLHQEVCNSQPCPSLSLPLKTLLKPFGELRVLGGMSRLFSLDGPAGNPSLLQTAVFGILWPRVCWAHEVELDSTVKLTDPVFTALMLQMGKPNFRLYSHSFIHLPFSSTCYVSAPC